MYNFRKNCVYLLCSALPVIAALEWPQSLGFFALIGLAAFFLWLYKQNSPFIAFKGGIFFGFLVLGYSIRWFLAVDPGALASIESVIGLYLIRAFVWGGSSLVLALGIGFFSYIFVKYRRFNWQDLIFVPALWVLCEYGRNWLFVFWSWGGQSVLQPNWTFGAFGYFLVNTPLVYLSRFIGLYGLSFVAAELAMLMFFALLGLRDENIQFARPCAARLARAERFFSRKIRVSRKVHIFIPFLLGSMVFFIISLLAKNMPLAYKKPINTAIFQGSTSPPAFYTRALSDLLIKDKLSGKIQKESKLMVFPEGSQYFSNDYGPLEKEIISTVFGPSAGGGKAVIITNSYKRNNGGQRVQTAYKNEQGDTLAEYGKSFLIPTGEYMPDIIYWGLKLIGAKDTLESFESMRAVTKSVSKERAVQIEDNAYGTVSCSGIIAPDLYRGLVKDGAEILVNTASYGVFGGSPFFFKQMMVSGKFQAISLARQYIQSSMDGYSYVIDEQGKFFGGKRELGNKMIYQTVSPISTRDFYVKFGDLPVLLFSVSAAAFMILLKKRNESNEA